MDDILMADLVKACRVPAPRISETAAGLGYARGNEGRRLKKLTVVEAIRIAVTRELMEAGLAAAAALDIGRQIREADLTDIIASEQRKWLLVRKDEGGSAEFAFTIASLQEAVEIFTDEPESTDELVAQIGGGGQPRNIRIVDLHKVIRAVLVAAAERRGAIDTTKESKRVSTIDTEAKVSGCVLHSDLRLAVVKDGRGNVIRLNVEEARDLAARLLETAAAVEAGRVRELN